jgi:hypothetical protein
MTVAAASDAASNRGSAAIIPVNSVIPVIPVVPRVAVPLTFTLAALALALAFAFVTPGIALGFTVAGRMHLRIGRTVKMNNGGGGINDESTQAEFG